MDEAPPGSVVMALAASAISSNPQASSSRASGEAAPAPAASPAPGAPAVAAVPVGTERRQRFVAELKAGETTIVSWKKLLRDASKGDGSVSAPAAAGATTTGDRPGLESRIAPTAAANDYFQVDKSSTKHQGFFVNRGKLERVEPKSSPTLAPNKRRRKDTINPTTGKDAGSLPNEIVNMGNVKMKAAARNAPLIGKKSLNSSPIPTNNVESYQEGKYLKNKSSIDTEIIKKTEFSVAENSAYLKMPSEESARPIDTEKQKTGVVQSRESNKLKGIGETFDAVNEVYRAKSVSLREEYNLLGSSRKHQFRKKNGTVELPDLNIPGNIYPMQTMGESTQVKQATSVRPKGTTLERAIRDLEKIVAEYRPPKVDIQDVDCSQGAKKRLPLEVKQKLAKVARLAGSQGKITSEQFIDQLMVILGHLVKPTTLKRHLKEMVELGLSAKQEKEDRFQQIKKEVIEMIKTRIVAQKSRDPPKAKFRMDAAIEDKICYLYDLYVEGMDEDRGPQAKKLYVELEELWPAGYMDKVGIKDVVNRARERKRAVNKHHKVLDEERIKGKRLSAAARMEDTARQTHQAQAGQDRLSDAAFSLNGSSHHHGAKHHEKFRGCHSTIITTDESSKAIVTMTRKKMKRKAEMEFRSVHAHATKHASHLDKDKDKCPKHSAVSSDSHLYKSSLLTPSIPGSEQQS